MLNFISAIKLLSRRAYTYINKMPKRKKTTASKQKVTKDVVKKAKPGQKTTASKQEVTNDVVKKAKHEQTEKQSNSTITSGGDTSVVPSKSISDSHRQPFSFYDIPCEDLAKSLLGQKLVHVVDKKRLTGVIVETEAYLGPIDKGAHSYEGKRTAKNEAMFMPPGTAYVYNIYGMYCCMNISAKGKFWNILKLLWRVRTSEHHCT